MLSNIKQIYTLFFVIPNFAKKKGKNFFSSSLLYSFLPVINLIQQPRNYIFIIQLVLLTLYTILHIYHKAKKGLKNQKAFWLWFLPILFIFKVIFIILMSFGKFQFLYLLLWHAVLKLSYRLCCTRPSTGTQQKEL